MKYKKSDFNKLFYGEHNEQITAIRNLSNDESNFLDKTESSFLQNSIIDNEEKSSDGKINQLKINNNNLDAKFQSIKTKLQLSSDDLEKRAD